jgi:hypothetical protein
MHKHYKNNTGSKSIIQGGNYKIKILEKCPCNVLIELRQKEQKYLERYREKYGELVLNKKNPFPTEEQKREQNRIRTKKWANNNPEKIKESSANYYQNNREKINARTNEKFDCVCGGKYTRKNKAKHCESIRHQDYISKINENKI